MLGYWLRAVTRSLYDPDISTKEKAQKYIGLDMEQLRKDKERFMKEVAVKWVEDAKASQRLLEK